MAPPAVRRVAVAVLDALLPPRCLACGGTVDRQGGLCPACWGRLTFITAPQCACCGTPFEFAMEPGALCGACLAEPPPFARARSVLAYDDGSRPLVLGFKHADRTHAAVPFGVWLARVGREILADADLLVPVPLHRWRLFRRRYNQAALLARSAGRAAGVAVDPALIRRRRATASQGTFSRTGRRRNVAGAFVIPAGARARVSGRRIVLVDDVLTTGATVAECAKVLLAAGAARVDVLTLARVVLR